jgi:hypothetical protein
VRVCYVWHTTGVHHWPDLLARKQVIFAASARGTAGNIDAAMLRELFGVQIKEVQGYSGRDRKRPRPPASPSSRTTHAVNSGLGK